MKFLNNMKNGIVSLLMLFVMVFVASSCSDDEAPEPALEVIPVNLHGVWKLQELNGQELPENLYVYINLNRKGTFELYQNHDSMDARCITGTFSIEQDDDLGAIISGKYDFGTGLWNNQYIVTDLLASGSMIWTVKDGDEVSKYVRVDKVPDEIVNAAK